MTPAAVAKMIQDILRQLAAMEVYMSILEKNKGE